MRHARIFYKLLFTLAAGGFIAAAGNGWSQYARTGPAAGGGLAPYSPPGTGQSFTSSEFRKLNCSPGATVAGRDSYYQCNGMWLKKTYTGGRVLYVVVPGPPSY